jgi:hypothetical protein
VQHRGRRMPAVGDHQSARDQEILSHEALRRRRRQRPRFRRAARR